MEGMEQKAQREIRVFLDANVLIAAVLSPSGGSFRVCSESPERAFKLITSRYAYKEAYRNIQEKCPEFLDILVRFSSSFHLVSDASERELIRLRNMIDFKDLPILATALKARARALITLDRKHFLENKKLTENYPLLQILTPGDFIKRYFV